MANTRQSTKRAKQAESRRTRNTVVRSVTKTVLRAAIESIRAKDTEKAKVAFKDAIKSLSKAASKGAIPKGRAARKISRLTRLAKKTTPSVVSAK